MRLRSTAPSATGFEIDRKRTPPRRVTRAGTEAIEAIFRFETGRIRGQGVLRLLPEDDLRAWTLLTALDEIKGLEESTGSRRPHGESYSAGFPRPELARPEEEGLRLRGPATRKC